MEIKYAGATDVGRVRDHNEDDYLLLPDDNLMLVCDGMGGHAAGEVASSIAVETVKRAYEVYDLDLFASEQLPYPVELTSEAKLLAGAVTMANLRVYEHGRRDRGHAGMGTTLVGCHFHENGVVSICHVGDSRGYLIREGVIRRITVDHSWVNELMEKHNITEEESRSYVNSNVITRALGTKEVVKVDVSEITYRTGDIFLLCSDGLPGMLSDSAIMSTVKAHPDDIDELVADLIARANDAGGTDNITVCVASVLEQAPPADFEEVRRATVDWGAGDLPAFIHSAVAEMFGEADPESNVETTGIAVQPEKKKRRSLTFLLILLILLLILLLLIQFELI
jgi:protein phosphatase